LIISSQIIYIQALVLSRMDYWNGLLAGLPAFTVKLLQLIQNAAASVTPLLTILHWSLIAACIKFKPLMLAYRTTTGSAPFYLNSLGYLRLTCHSETCILASEHHLVVPSQRGTKSLSKTLPGLTQSESVDIFKKRLKT